MYSTEKLITEVQNYPCIWDMSSNDLKCLSQIMEISKNTIENNLYV